MTIERVEVFPVTYRLPRLRIYAIGSHWDRNAVLVKITDRDGVSGWGETYLITGIVQTIEAVAPRLVGAIPEQAASLCAELFFATRNNWAVGAISTALDDLRARRARVPVHTLYGGPLRMRVRAYGSSGGYVEGIELGAAWTEEAASLRAAGFTAMKYRIGRYPPSVELAALARARAAVPDIEMMADGNAGYTLSQSIAVGRELGRLGFSWLEEPLPQTDYAGYERVTAACDIAIAGGELTETRGQARILLERAAVDIVQPDVAICGGIGEVLFIAALARLRAISCVPHTCNGAIALAATLHLLACLPEASNLPGGVPPLLECDAGENPIRTDLLASPLRMETDGFFTIPSGPGLGVEVDEGFVRAHLA